MAHLRFHREDLIHFLKQHQIATMPELKAALGTRVDVTVFRKLKQIGYLSSYSQRGRYYTLAETAHFDEQGLWSCRGVHFSRYGTLRSSAQALVEASAAGYFARGLQSLLQVGVKEALLELVRQGRLSRRPLSGRYLYCSAQEVVGPRQWQQRQRLEARREVGDFLLAAGVLPEQLTTALDLFFGLLDEKQRRLYAGLESLKIGHGGDRQVARALALDAATVARGRRQLLSEDFPRQRIRRPGGGRKAVEKKRPKSSPRSNS
jgi:hypothetical protein